MYIRRFFTRFLTLLIAAAWLLALPALAVPESGQEQLELLEEIAEYLDAFALYPPDSLSLDGITAADLKKNPELFLSIVEKWLVGDPYGHFMSVEEYNSAFSVTGLVYGIGIEVDTAMTLGIYVVSFLPGGGAGESGMEIGAQVVSIDGVDVSDAIYMDVRELILGEEGTTVAIGYINPGSAEVHIEEIRRGPLGVDNVTCEIIEGTSIGYLRLDQFGSIADYFDFDYYYNEYLPYSGADSVIIDLRGNPGGQLDTILNILNVMLKEEGYLLCELVGSDEEMSAVYYSTGWDDEQLAQWGAIIWQPETIVVLVDGGSASASEVFTGMLQAYGLATVVGETTYGKSHSQYHLELTSGDILITTTDRIELYETGTYEGVGITPDYIVEPDIFTGAELVQYNLDTSRALFRQSIMTERILAMQERMALLGYYRADPSGVFDDYTLWCLNRFQVAHELPTVNYASAEALRVLDLTAAETEFYADAQLAFAIDLCETGGELAAAAGQ